MSTLYITDLDGTLLRGDGSLSAYTVDTLNGLIARGLRFTYATARSVESAQELVSQLRLTLPVATYNGAVICAPDGQGYRQGATFSYEAFAERLDALLHAGFRPLAHAFVDGRPRVAWLEGQEDPHIKRYLLDRPGDPRMCPVSCASSLYAGELINLTLIGTEADMRRARDLLEAQPGLRTHLQQDTYPPHAFWLEVQHPGASKAHAVARLKALTGASRVVCFGDNHNDLPLLAAADEGYAAQNAVSALRAAATGVIGSNQADGVARFLARRCGGTDP